MRVAWVCFEDDDEALVRLLQDYVDISIWMPLGSPHRFYDSLGFPVAEFTYEEPFLSWIEYHDAIFYVVKSEYHLEKVRKLPSGILFIKEDIGLHTFSSIEESLFNFLLEEDPLNLSLFLISYIPLKGEVLCPYKVLDHNMNSVSLVSELIKAVRMADAYRPFHKALRLLKDRFFVGMDKEHIVLKSFVEELTEELSTLYKSYKPLVYKIS